MQSPRNQRFIALKASQGLSVNEIYRRCLERLTWDGPLPTIHEIESISRAAGSARAAPPALHSRGTGGADTKGGAW